MGVIEAVLLTPGGREERETHSFEEFFELLTDCLESREAVEHAVAGGKFPLNEIEYRFAPSAEFTRYAAPLVAALPVPEPGRPFSAERCVAVTFPFQTSAEEGAERLRPSQGLSFHRRDMTGAEGTAPGGRRGLLGPSLWEVLQSFPVRRGARYSGFHLGARIDRYRVEIEGREINALLAEITRSSYRPAREMLDYLSYYRPEKIALFYSCERA